MKLRIRYLPFAAVFVALLILVMVVARAFARGRRLTNCPHCRSSRLRPSWPTTLDRFVLTYCSITPWRCEACRNRFYLRK
jgi:hypothetical protein